MWCHTRLQSWLQQESAEAREQALNGLLEHARRSQDGTAAMAALYWSFHAEVAGARAPHAARVARQVLNLANARPRPFGSWRRAERPWRPRRSGPADERVFQSSRRR
jgi:hypothetical protein